MTHARIAAAGLAACLVMFCAPALAATPPKHQHHHHQTPGPKPHKPTPAPAPAPVPAPAPSYTAPATTTPAAPATAPAPATKPAVHKPAARHKPRPAPHRAAKHSAAASKAPPLAKSKPASAPLVKQSSGGLPVTLIAGVLLALAAVLAATAIATKVIRDRRLAAGHGDLAWEEPAIAAGAVGGRRLPWRREHAVARERRLPWRRHRLTDEHDTPPQGYAAVVPGGEAPRGDRLRVFGDRLRVALDERGIEFAIVGLGLAAAVLLGALVGGL